MLFLNFILKIYKKVKVLENYFIFGKEYCFNSVELINIILIIYNVIFRIVFILCFLERKF